MNEQASKHYQTQQIMTASPATLVFMLLDKAIVCLKEAIRAIEAKDIESRWRANARAMEIISHLKSTLDHDKGGIIARNLDQLYSFMLSHLPKVDFANDANAAQSVIELLVPFRDSWKELASRGNGPLQDAAKLASQSLPPAAAKAAPIGPVTTQPAKRPEPPSDRPRLAISA
jgi:flagellar protein FliS